MRKFKVCLILYAVAISLNASAVEYVGGDRNTSYAFGLGSYKMGTPEIGMIPLDLRHLGDFTHFQLVLGYGLDSNDFDTDHLVALMLPVSFQIARKGPFRVGFGFDFQNYLQVSDYYYGTHTFGPLFSLANDIPYNNSVNEFTWGLGFGVLADEYDAVFITDMTFRDNLQIYFNEKVGINISADVSVNVIAENDYGYSYVNRALLYVGPCFRW
jgi:hypothetical protein